MKSFKPRIRGFVTSLRRQLIRSKPDHLLPKPRIQLLKPFLQRCQLITNKHLRRLHRIAKPAAVLRNDAHHLRWHAVRAKQIVLAGFLDVEEIVFRGDFTQWQNLDTVRLAVGCIHEQIAEVAQAFCVAHRLAHLIDVRAALCRVGHVQDISGVCPDSNP